MYSACTALAAICYVAWQPRSLLITWAPTSAAEVPLLACCQTVTESSLFGSLYVQRLFVNDLQLFLLELWPTCAAGLSAGGRAAQPAGVHQRRLLWLPALDAGPQQVHLPGISCAPCETLGGGAWATLLGLLEPILHGKTG